MLVQQGELTFILIATQYADTTISRFNSTLVAGRRANMDGVYDPHTNLMWYPKIMQPTHAKWEDLTLTASDAQKLSSKKQAHLINGVSEADNEDSRERPSSEDSIFPPVPPIVARNFLVTDLHYISPSLSGLGVPGPDRAFHDVGPNGLADISEDVLAELPPECRQAFEKAKNCETEWKDTWHTETVDGARASLKIGFSGVPV